MAALPTSNPARFVVFLPAPRTPVESIMRLLISLPFLLLLVLFALSNTGTVQVGIWPTDLSLHAPLSLVILGGMAIAFLLGGVLVWFSELGQRARARRAERMVRMLEAQVEDLKARIPQPALLPPAL